MTASYTADTWADNDPSKPLSAARVTKLAGQYQAAMTDTAALYGQDVRPWAPNTQYAAAQAVVSPSGDVVTAKAAFTSGATFDPTKWNLSATFEPAGLSTATKATLEPAGLSTATKATVVQPWAANTAYAAGQAAVSPSGDVVTAKTAHTSGASFSGTAPGGNWNASATTTTAQAAKVLPGLLWGFMGDSITNGSTASNWSYSFGPQAIAMVGGMVARPDSFTNGVPGQTSAAMLARFSTFLGYGPQAMVLLAGTNDASQAVPLTTYISNMTAMINAAKQAGIPTVVVTVPPRSSSTAAPIHNAVLAENAWIRLYAPTLGVEIADAYTALVDTTTGYLAAAYDSGDGTHPNTLGHQLIAEQVAKAMKRVQSRYQFNLLTSVQPGNLITDPLAASGGTKPTGFNEWPGGTGTAPTYSIVADTSGVLPAGKWAQMDFDGTSAGGTRRLASAGISTGFSVGDVLAAVATIQVEDVSGTWRTDVTSAVGSVGLTVINQSGVGIGSPNGRCSGIKDAAGFYDQGPIIYPFTVPSGTTSMNIWYSLTVPTGAHYKMRIGTLGLLNLTQLGLAGLINWGGSPVTH